MDLNFIRKQFPSLREDYVFMDNAGGSQTLGSVIEKVKEYYLTSDVQMGGNYTVSLQARERVQAGEKTAAMFMNAPSRETVVMGSSTTMLIRLFSICIGKTLQPGDEIIITNTDHEANRTPWLDLQQQGIIIKIWEFNKESFQLELEDLKPLITNKTKLVSFCHVSNIFGTIHDVKKMTQWIHNKGVKVFVDGVAYAPHRAIDVQDWDVDFYVFSWYKVFAGHCAVLYGKKEHLLSLPGINHQFIPADDIPYKFQPGGANYELTYSITGVLDYFNTVCSHHGVKASSRENIVKGFEIFDEQEKALTEHLLNFLKTKSNVSIIGEKSSDSTKRVATVAFIHSEKNAADIESKVHPHNIGIKTGDFYAKGITKALGLDDRGGVVRVSLAHYNSFEELNKLIRIFDEVL